MSWNDDRFKPVNLLKLESLGVGRARHAGQSLIHAEIVLESDRGECLVFLLDRNTFLCFHRLMQSFRPAPARHEPPGELVDDDHLAILYHVVLVKME